ncbi:MAG: hypothetical protein ABIR91_04770 [Candidatus Saccharimonadales bacterium]
MQSGQPQAVCGGQVTRLSLDGYSHNAVWVLYPPADLSRFLDTVGSEHYTKQVNALDHVVYEIDTVSSFERGSKLLGGPTVESSFIPYRYYIFDTQNSTCHDAMHDLP